MSFLPVSRRLPLDWLTSAALLLVSFNASAAFSCAPEGQQTETIAMPTQIKIPRDAAVGTPLTGWIYSGSAVTRTCTADPTQSNTVGMVVGTSGYFEDLASFKVKNEAGVQVLVFQTPLRGVGVAITARLMQCGTWSNWRAVPASISCRGTTTPLSLPMQSQVGVMLVVTGPMDAGLVNQSAVAGQHPIDAGYEDARPDFELLYRLSDTTIVASACTTPDVTVDLGQQKLSQFASVGSMSAPVSFQFKLNDCSTGIKAIRYSLRSKAAQANLAGVIGATAASTSSGIGVKLMGSDGTALPIDGSKIDVKGYDTAVGGSLTIPMKAAMTRTSAAAATAGTLEAEVEVTMYYE